MYERIYIGGAAEMNRNNLTLLVTRSPVGIVRFLDAPVVIFRMDLPLIAEQKKKQVHPCSKLKHNVHKVHGYQDFALVYWLPLLDRLSPLT